MQMTAQWEKYQQWSMGCQARDGLVENCLNYGLLTHHFLVYATPVRPCLFLMDGHSSHFHPDETAAEGVTICLVSLHIRLTSCST